MAAVTESLPRLTGKEGLAVKADTEANGSSVKIDSFIVVSDGGFC